MDESDARVRSSEATQAVQAASFGPVARDYERGRPGYPEAAISWLVGATPARVIDVGAGTGKLTRQLEELGHEVVALEPSEQMLAVLRRVSRGSHAICGRAEAMPVRESWADAVTVAQAFHWFDREAALEELTRVLKAGGRLGLLWNNRDDSVAWVAALSRLIGSESIGEESLAEVQAARAFASIERREFRLVQTLDADDLVALVASRSYVATLSERKRREILNQVSDLCGTHPQLEGRRHFELPYITVAIKARLRG